MVIFLKNILLHWSLVTTLFLLQDVVEYLAKISNTVINLLGIIGLIIGLSEIQELQFRDPENNLILEMDLVSLGNLVNLFVHGGSELGFESPTPTLMAFTGVTNTLDPHPSQQHAGLHHAVWQLQQEVTTPKGRFKPS